MKFYVFDVRCFLPRGTSERSRGPAADFCPRFYTFGPLHWYYFSPLKIPMFASIFAIVLFLAVVFRRSGNLWIVAVIYGIGNAYIVGSLPSTSKLSNRLQPPKPDDAIN